MRAPWLVIAFVAALLATVIVALAADHPNSGDAMHALVAIDIGLAGAIGGAHFPIDGRRK